MNPSKNNGNLRTNVDSQDIGVNAERAADTTLQEWNRLLERQLAERTQELGRSLVDVQEVDDVLAQALLHSKL